MTDFNPQNAGFSSVSSSTTVVSMYFSILHNRAFVSGNLMTPLTSFAHWIALHFRLLAGGDTCQKQGGRDLLLRRPRLESARPHVARVLMDAQAVLGHSTSSQISPLGFGATKHKFQARLAEQLGRQPRSTLWSSPFRVRTASDRDGLVECYTYLFAGLEFGGTDRGSRHYQLPTLSG